jgi:hypothetical protein
MRTICGAVASAEVNVEAESRAVRASLWGEGSSSSMSGGGEVEVQQVEGRISAVAGIKGV